MKTIHPEEKTAWIMIAPALLGLVLFIALPFAISGVLSFAFYKLDSPLPISFAGFEQFRRTFTDEAFQQALTNNAIFAAAIVPVQTAAALCLAMLLNRKIPGITGYRALFFLPVIFPMALVAVVWELIYAPGAQGLLNALLHAASFGLWAPVDFLHQQGYALPAVMILSIWQGVGFQMVILLAALQSIPKNLYEAAAIDGAGKLRQFIHVTLPGLRNSLIFVALVTTVLAFRLFDQVWILTQGGPNNATTTIMFETVRAVFYRQDVARGAAMSVVFFLLVLGITLFQQHVLRRGKV